jgi:uncharacterized protein YqiB (DUF1249 family)
MRKDVGALMPQRNGSTPPPGRASYVRRYRVDFPTFMDECDANYARLVTLMPLLTFCGTCRFDFVIPLLGLRVRMSVLERCPYTTLVELTQCIADNAALPAPRLKVRLYHDAKSAEVIEFQNARRFAAVYPYPNAEMRQPDEKAQVNRFLGEYLMLCLAHDGEIEEPVLAASD